MGELTRLFSRQGLIDSTQDLVEAMDAIVTLARKVRNAPTDVQELELARQLVKLILGEEDEPK